MRALRIGVLIVFSVVAVMFASMYISNLISVDKTIPVITVDSEMLEVGVKATDEDLLKGVTAYDEKDKDITDKVIVESVSNFIQKGVCKVTYAVCDSNHHVAKATRKIKYKDYKSPSFRMKRSTCYSLYEHIDLYEAIFADDCIDGNVSNNIIITSQNYTNNVAGVFNLDVSVSNSNGDVSEMSIPLIIEDRSLAAPVIELKDYFVYVKKDAAFNPSEYLVSAKDVRDEDVKATVRIESKVDTKKEGIYSVHYYATDSEGVQGHNVLLVKVTGE